MSLCPSVVDHPGGLGPVADLSIEPAAPLLSQQIQSLHRVRSRCRRNEGAWASRPPDRPAGRPFCLLRQPQAVRREGRGYGRSSHRSTASQPSGGQRASRRGRWQRRSEYGQEGHFPRRAPSTRRIWWSMCVHWANTPAWPAGYLLFGVMSGQARSSPA